MGSLAGGGIANKASSNLMLTNCILWENRDTEGAGELAQIYIAPPVGLIQIGYSCIQAWSGDFGGVGNIGVNPLFILPAGADATIGTIDDNLRVPPGSPCVDTGDNAAIPPGVTTDLAGNPRLQHFTVDMGAYEVNLNDPADILAAVSRKTHGIAGDFDINLQTPLPGQVVPVECRDGGPTTLVILFDKPIQGVGGLDSTDVTLSTTGALPGTVDNLFINGSELTVEMSGTSNLAALTVAFPGITDFDDVVVNTTLCFGALIGDTDGTGAVNIFDLIAIRNQLNMPVEQASYRSDVNFDGAINIFDLILTRNMLNSLLPNPPCP